MDIYEVMKTRRSVRSYLPDPVPKEKLNKILQAAQMAPSGGNKQPWKFIIIQDEQKKKGLIPFVHGVNDHNKDIARQAPIVVVACGQKLGINRAGYMGDLSMLVDVSIATTHLMLAARAEGLGTCWLGGFDNAKIKDYLSIPPDYQIVALLTLGFPKKQEFTETSNRKKLSEIVCYDEFK